eukprot:CAMPEP_0201506572 /NCGR_PEP_ID=MMETSP0161_2-20130828/486_1 /ASSEMBLY_ACC=CAM_ASM_000251 /TAXON_ID=180227 /ORGANISM="Neoparamoeba aestuarina, Strain SoJaBio B1-5/56/2" /LENGTH=105 /DNA_ID=CAMNT_0047900707 /DNA_START=88 /DNA_END=405 /DNA_ORIENTATION=-
MSNLKSVTDKAEYDQITKGSGLVVVDFGATWCGPCKKIAPTFASIAGEHSDATFLKVDIDDAEEIASVLKVASVPTFIFYKDGEQVERFSGANANKLKEAVEKHK